MSLNLLVGYFLLSLLPATVGALFLQALDIRGKGRALDIGFIKSAPLAALATSIIIVIFSIEFVTALVIGFILGAIFEFVRDIDDEKKSMPYRIAQVKKSQKK